MKQKLCNTVWLEKYSFTTDMTMPIVNIQDILLKNIKIILVLLLKVVYEIFLKHNKEMGSDTAYLKVK